MQCNTVLIIILSRQKRMSRGERYYPNEYESIIRMHPNEYPNLRMLRGHQRITNLYEFTNLRMCEFIS